MLHECLSVFLKTSIQLALVILPGAPLLWAKASSTAGVERFSASHGIQHPDYREVLHRDLCIAIHRYFLLKHPRADG